MAELSAQEKGKIRQQFEDEESSAQNVIGIGQEHSTAVVTAMDQWIGDNIPSLKAALPEPGKSDLTNKQILKYFLLVVEKRFDLEIM